MTDIQLLTLALAVIVPLSLLIYSNSRISDVRASVTDAKETLRAEMRAQMAELRGDLQAQNAELRALIERNHSEMLAKFAEMDSRLARIESERRIVQ
jgi:predicted nuclease with TOPRIM domain